MSRYDELVTQLRTMDDSELGCKAADLIEAQERWIAALEELADVASKIDGRTEHDTYDWALFMKLSKPIA